MGNEYGEIPHFLDVIGAAQLIFAGIPSVQVT